MDPLDSPAAWVAALEEILNKFPGLTVHALPGWKQVAGADFNSAAENVGMVRILGLDCPLDIFRRPNEFPADSFDEVFARGTTNSDGTRLPDPLDLIVTKLNTGRPQDFHDSQHLESVIRSRYAKLLPSASLDEVRQLLDRFLDWRVCQFALDNPAPDVREYALECLREMARDGDPFSQALLDDKKIPYSTP